MPKWATFSTVPEDSDETVEWFETYKEAVFNAQCIHDTGQRPKRENAGLYKLGGEHYSSWIAREDRLSELVLSRAGKPRR